MLIKAPAKINLTLRVLSKRADGYHEISSEMQAIRLFDEVEIALRKRTDGKDRGIHVSADMAGLPAGPENLAYRAAEAALNAWEKQADIHITLRKNIPVSAGLAGGSSNAAAVLLGLAKELKPEAEISEIAALGAGIGADVPFCIYSCAAANPDLGHEGTGLALVEGIGERITPLPESGPGQGSNPARVLLVKPDSGISTKEIYRLYDLEQCDPAHLDFPSQNDLQGCCIKAYPVVAEVIRKLEEIHSEWEEKGEGRLPSTIQLSGSGPAVFMYVPVPAKLTNSSRESLRTGDPEYDEAVNFIHARARETFPSMFVCLTETI